jgi:HAD superfamily hydrolase (TIGR01509 family)
MKKPDYKIYCDMDGVLADFIGGISRRHYAGRDWDELKKQHDLNAKRWTDLFRKKVQLDSKFWETLDLMPGARLLWNTIKKHDVYILSAYATWDEENSKRGKIRWLAKHFRIPESRVYLVVREDKEKYAKKNSILIDDYIKNIHEWEAKGGIGIHHTSAEKTVEELKKLGIK